MPFHHCVKEMHKVYETTEDNEIGRLYLLSEMPCCKTNGNHAVIFKKMPAVQCPNCGKEIAEAMLRGQS